jgi:branched-chain amino acid transport system substrate-binding protein
VEFVIEDTKGDAPTATAAAARLVDEDVVAVVSVDAFAEGVYAQSVADAGIPVIGGAGFDPTVWGGLPNVLPVMTTFPSWANAPMVLADSLGDERVGVGVCAEVATCEGIAATAQTAAEALGLSYAGTVRVAAAAPDFTAECLQLVNDNVDFLWVGHAAAVSLRFIESCATQGFTGHWVMAGGAVEPEVFLANDPSVKIDLVLFSFPWWVDDEPVAAYRELMEEQGVPETNWATQQSTAVYATMELFRTALDSNAATLPESPMAQDILDAYATLDGETLDGLLPQPISFTPGQPQAQVTCYWYAQFEDGEFTGADLSEPVCDPSELG